MESHRLESLDILRGHLLIAIFVDHIIWIVGTSIFRLYNGSGSLWVSAAEGFVLLSGFMFGYLYIYKDSLLMKQIVKKILSRTTQIYVLSVLLTLFFTIFFWEFTMPLSGSITELVTHTNLDILINALSFRYAYGWADILSLYVYFMIISPIVIYFLKKEKTLLILSLSFLVWLLSNMGFCNGFRVSSFIIFSWQILFVFGIFLGSKYSTLEKIVGKILERKFVIVGFYILWAVLIYLSIRFPSVSIQNYDIFNKDILAIGRLALVPFWIFMFWVTLKIVFKRFPKWFVNYYALLGRNSAMVYAVEAVFLAFITMFYAKGDIRIDNAILTVLLLIAIGGVTFIIERLKLSNKRLKKIIP